MFGKLLNGKPFKFHVGLTVLLPLLIIFIIVFSVSRSLIYNQDSTSRSQLFEKMANEYRLTALSATQGARTGLELLRFNELQNEPEWSGRRQQLAQLANYLEKNLEINDVALAYPNGDLLIFSANFDRELPKGTRPSKVSWYLEESTVDGFYHQLVFLDKELNVLGEHSLSKRNKHPGDPRQLSWYQNAVKSTKGEIIQSPLNTFFGAKKLGVTLASKMSDTNTVVATSITLEDINAEMAKFPPLPDKSSIVVVDNQTLLYANPALLEQINIRPSESYLQSKNPLFEGIRFFSLEEKEHAVMEKRRYMMDSGAWVFYFTKSMVNSNYLLVIAAPEEMFNEGAMQSMRVFSVILIALFVPCIVILLWASRRISNPLLSLTEEAKRINRFNFDAPTLQRSDIFEVDQLTLAIEHSKRTHQNFIKLGRVLAEEQEYDRLQDRLLLDSSQMLNALMAVLYIQEDGVLTPVRLCCKGDVQSPRKLPAIKPEQDLFASLYQGDTVITNFSQEYWGLHLSSWTRYPVSANTVLAIPLFDQHREIAGAISFIILDSDAEELKDIIKMMEAIAGSIGAALRTQNLLQEQKKLIDAFIELVAGAIDAKSQHTGGHCLRVPLLTQKLAEAASRDKSEYFANFKPTEHDWEMIRIASWLHDCGKITTPEYVVDKATKLETLYDRIHEIRTRFEVLKRDVEIAALTKRVDVQELRTIRAEIAPELKQLDDEYSFIARCNQGDNFTSAEDVARLEQIAQRTWMRTLDNRIGLSREELGRMTKQDRIKLPVQEYLLSNRPEHLIHREREEQYAEYGIKMEIPKYLYNRGELYNLSVARGTLTNEERYKINEHIIHTIKMLKCLPFPKHLSAIPDIAGGHHERVDGKGYPRALTIDDQPMAARILAIADVFEALTASDRPYKDFKTISQSLKIMKFMALEGHLDPQLYNLFLRAEIWRGYGKEFLLPAQFDEVDIQSFLVETK